MHLSRLIRHIAATMAAVALLACVGVATASEPSVAPSPQTQEASAPDPKRVMIISVDGLRPDLALRAQTPVIHDLIKRGTFTFWARTTAVSITLPSHVSMLTGVVPGKHEIEWNEDLDLKTPFYPHWPTLFEVARKAGFTTAMVAGKSKFSALAKPETLDWCYVPSESKVSDQRIGDLAAAMIHEHKPQVLFVHLPEVDKVGHDSGWSSAEQIKAIENADAQIGRMLNALDQEHLRDRALLIVTADHGGAGRTHGADDPRSRNIPWIAVGPGVHEGFDLTIYRPLVVNTEDTFATACWFLGIPLADDIDGKPVTQIVQPIRTVGRYE